ncbi:MAG: hypothetical protein GY832_37135 [Chloroflexi bacterium]|nr:hypothetical protein [Chloroflexota bacterium]
MPKPIAICIENLDTQSTSKYLRCVALPGRQPGLRLDETGRVLWQSDDGVSCELWVSADGRLVLYRPETNIPVTLHRAGRSLSVPCGKPVIVIDQDQVDVGARHLRIHVHGQALAINAPSPLPSRTRSFGRLAQAAATAAVIGAVTAAGGCTDADFLATPTIEIIENPPEVAPIPETTIVEAIQQGEWIAVQAYDMGDERGWITGTLTIEASSYSFAPTREITGTSVQGNLAFLFNNPIGEVTIDYLVPQEDDFDWYNSGDTIATCTFSTDSALGEFQIRIGDSGDLYFAPSDEDGLWSITKQIY